MDPFFFLILGVREPPIWLIIFQVYILQLFIRSILDLKLFNNTSSSVIFIKSK